MRYTRYEIRKRLDVAANPCALFELINRYTAPANFRFEFSLTDDQREIHISTTPRHSLSTHPDNILDGRIPELFDSEGWIVQLERKRYTLDSAYQEIDPPLENPTNVSWRESETATEDFAIKIDGFLQRKGPEGIPATFTNDQKVTEEVYRRTWIGGLKHLEAGTALEWVVLGRPLKISTTNRRKDLDDQGMSSVIQARAGSVTVYLAVSTTPSSNKYRSIRIAGQGEATYQDWLKPVAEALENHPINFDSWICEIDCPELVTGNDLVKKISDARKDDLETVADKLVREKTIVGAAEVLYQNRLAPRRIQLEDRIRASQRADQVFYKSEVLMNVPTAETGTVALFHILEGRGGLPFEFFRTRSWTPKVGIDAIADFRLTPGELLREHVPIEFEHRFDSYIAHGHEPEHTDLIICWTVGDGSKRNRKLTRHRLGRGWLWNYRSESGLDVPVAEIRKFPGLIIQTKGVAGA